jgi:hypothetical protein
MLLRRNTNKIRVMLKLFAGFTQYVTLSRSYIKLNYVWADLTIPPLPVPVRDCFEVAEWDVVKYDPRIENVCILFFDLSVIVLMATAL